MIHKNSIFKVTFNINEFFDKTFFLFDNFMKFFIKQNALWFAKIILIKSNEIFSETYTNCLLWNILIHVKLNEKYMNKYIVKARQWNTQQRHRSKILAFYRTHRTKYRTRSFSIPKLMFVSLYQCFKALVTHKRHFWEFYWDQGEPPWRGPLT